MCISASLPSLNPVLAFHWHDLPENHREEGLGNPSSPFRLVPKPELADVCILPRKWNYYLWSKKVNEAISLAKQAEQGGKRILVWHDGDLPVRVPFSNAVLFQPGLYRSKRNRFEFAAPRFIDDPVPMLPCNRINTRRKEVQPVIGFCGYAALKPAKIAYAMFHNLVHNLSPYSRRRYRSVRVFPATVLRARALALLARDTRVTGKFLVRKRAFKRRDRKRPGSLDQIREFFRNMTEADYTLCVRGYGNWSIRFFETLACGRIPVFIDTDCMLPFDGALDWKKYCVWIEEAELCDIAEKVLAFHAELSTDEYVALQLTCRKLWEDRLSLPGFMAHLPEYLSNENCVLRTTRC